MHSKLQAALCLTYPPVAVYKTHQPPEGSIATPKLIQCNDAPDTPLTMNTPPS